MNLKEREAYNVGRYNLPGNYDGRLWETVGEHQWWQRGRREREEAGENAAGEASAEAGEKAIVTLEAYMAGVGRRLGYWIGFLGFLAGFGTGDQAGYETSIALAIGAGSAAFAMAVVRFMARLACVLVRAFSRWLLPSAIGELDLGFRSAPVSLLSGIGGMAFGLSNTLQNNTLVLILITIVTTAAGMVVGAAIPLLIRAVVDRVAARGRS